MLKFLYKENWKAVNYHNTIILNKELQIHLVKKFWSINCGV